MMKRKQLTILLTTVTALSMCACGKTEEVTQVSENMESVQTESTEIEQTENQAQTVKPKEGVLKTEAPTEAVIAEMLDHVLDWTGLQYFYKEDASIEHLGADEAIAMAAHAANQIQGGLEMDENYSLIIPQDVLDEMMVDYFGKTYEISEYTNPEYSMVQVTEDGMVMIHLYEIVDDHAATSDWYTVDRATGKGYDVNFNDVDLLEE